MAALGIGVKVAALPVIALGVGIGVDYALYLLSIQPAQQRAGASLALSYKRSIQLCPRGYSFGCRKHLTLEEERGWMFPTESPALPRRRGYSRDTDHSRGRSQEHTLPGSDHR